jgi:hexosaminidase
MTYPRAIALSQTLWSVEKIDYKIFKSILLNNHFKYLQAKNVNFSKSAFAPEIEWERSKGGVKFKINSSVEKDEIESALSKKEILKNRDSIKVENLNVTFSNNKWIEVNRTKKGLIQYNYYFKTSDNSSSSNFTINTTQALGLPVKYITEPSPNYNSGDLTLVDGQFGSLPWKGNEWIGYKENEIQIELDLGKKMTGCQISTSFLSDENSWIHFPEKVKIVLENGTDLVNPIVEINENQQIKTFSFLLTKKSQKIKIVVNSMKSIPNGQAGEGNIPWTFIDEIQVIR